MASSEAYGVIMINYTELEDGSLAYEMNGEYYHFYEGSVQHKEALQDVEDGEAIVTPFDRPDPRIASERAWRDNELHIADIELNKVQDGRGTGLVGDWRAYRNALRDWPETPGFPESEYRPAFTNSEGGQ